MILSKKIRLKPTKEQEKMLYKSAGTARFIYNWALNKQEENEYTEGYQGVWSSPSKNTIMWFVSNRIWPIDENKVEWQNADQLVIHERTGEQTYYQRQSAHIANSPYYP